MSAKSRLYCWLRGYSTKQDKRIKPKSLLWPARPSDLPSPLSCLISPFTFSALLLHLLLDVSQEHCPATAPRPLHQLFPCLEGSSPRDQYSPLLHLPEDFISLSHSYPNTSSRVWCSWGMRPEYVRPPVMSDHPYLLYCSPLRFRCLT